MIQLGHEALLREHLLFPPMRQLWGEHSVCIWNDRETSPLAAARVLRQDPEAACEQLELRDDQRLLLVDELLAHTRFTAAADLAAYMAATASLSPQWSQGRDQYVQVYLRLKGAQAAMEASAHGRARSVLLQVKTLCARLPECELTALLRANWHLLSGRLSQLSFLTLRSKTRLLEAQAAFTAAKDLPPGFQLLLLRNEMDWNPVETRFRLQELDPSTVAWSPGHVLAGYGEHYLEYLRGRADLATRSWEEARQRFVSAAQLLPVHGHAGFADPIRQGYCLLGEGRALVELGTSERIAAFVEEGLGLLLKARWQFKTEAFPPGEYLAYRAYSVAKARNERNRGMSLKRLKEVATLATRTRIIPFQVEAGLDYAIALHDEGRIALTRSTLKDVIRVADDSMAGEVREGEQWRRVLALVKRVENARQNGVDPFELWGVSEYALKESEFVRKAVEQGLLVSVFGQKGCGRRILITRIANARGQGGSLHVLYGENRSRAEVLEEFERQFTAHTPTILYDFDVWPVDVQLDVFRRLQELQPEAFARTYITLRGPLVGAELGNQLAPGLSDWFYQGNIEITPLQARVEDTLLLARGYLIHALISRGVASEDAKNLIFTGDACTFILHTFFHLTDLNQAMRYLASRLDMRRDVLVESAERSRIPAEVLRRELRPRTAESPGRPKDSRPNVGRRRGGSRPEILIADRAQVIDLYRRFKGKISPMADFHGIPRSTLIKRWTQSGMMKVWNEARTKQN